MIEAASISEQVCTVRGCLSCEAGQQSLQLVGPMPQNKQCLNVFGLVFLPFIFLALSEAAYGEPRSCSSPASA